LLVSIQPICIWVDTRWRIEAGNPWKQWEQVDARDEMPLYYFDIDDGLAATRDDTGIDFASREQVRAPAISALATIAADELPDGDVRRFTVRVRDLAGRYIFEASLGLSARWLD
jgi:hypothetical protein